MLTARFITSVAIPTSGCAEYPDEHRRGAGSLILRVYASSRKSFFIRARIDGRLVREKLGDFPEMTLAAARAAMPTTLERLREAARTPAPSTPAITPLTVTELSTLFLESRTRRSPVTIREYRRVVRTNVLPAIGDRQVADIVPGDILNILGAMTRANHDSMANHAYAVIRALFNHAVALGLIPAAPLLSRGVRPTNPPAQNTRALSLEEVRDFLRLSPEYLNPKIRLALWLSLATGQRVGEVCQLHESELSGGIWSLAGEEHRGHEIPLSPFALAVIDEARALADNSGYIFSSARGNTPHLLPNSLPAALRVRFFVNSGWPHRKFVAHDLRRTCATHLAEHGVSIQVVERILNHAPGGHMSSLVAVYNRAEYREPIATAMNWWGDVLADFLPGDAGRLT